MPAQKAVDLALSRLGLNQYTQTYLREQVFNGWSDCSSLVWKCFEKAYGIYVGSWTGEQVGKGQLLFKRSKAVKNARITKEEMAKLQPGDCLYYGDGYADHVEIYMGNGKQIGHGYGVGPRISDTLTYTHSSGFYQARRFYTEKSTDDPNKAETPAKAESSAKQSFPSYEPKYRVRVVDLDFLSVRKWAGTEYNRLVSVPELYTGDVVEVCDSTKDSTGDVWYFVKIPHNGNAVWGFIHSAYVERV